MEKRVIYYLLNMLNRDRSYKEFYFSPSTTEIERWEWLKEKGFVVMKNIENTTKYHIAFSDLGFSFIDQESDAGSVSSIIEELS